MIYKTVKRRKIFNDDSVLPLINIIFLLIIFFMVLGRIYPNDIKKADLMHMHSDKRYVKNNLTIFMNAKGQLFKNGNSIKLKKIDYKKGQKITLIINKTMPASVFVQNISHFKKLGVKTISIVVKQKL